LLGGVGLAIYEEFVNASERLVWNPDHDQSGLEGNAMPLKAHRLKVRELQGNDMYKDMARVWWEDRSGVKNGVIARISADGRKPHLLAMRGTVKDNKGTIAVDHLISEYMQLQPGKEYDFTFEPASWWEKIKWAANSAEPGARIATWIAIVSGIIGIIGLYPVIKEVSHDVARLYANFTQR
jgi:hypothetical protein